MGPARASVLTAPYRGKAIPFHGRGSLIGFPRVTWSDLVAITTTEIVSPSSAT